MNFILIRWRKDEDIGAVCACAKCCVFPLWSSLWPTMCVLSVCQGETLYLELKFSLKFPPSKQPIIKYHQWGYVTQQSGNLRRSLSPAPFCCRYATIREINFESHHKYTICVHKYVACLSNTPVRHLHFDCHDDAVFCRIWSFNGACTVLLTRKVLGKKILAMFWCHF